MRPNYRDGDYWDYDREERAERKPARVSIPPRPAERVEYGWQRQLGKLTRAFVRDGIRDLEIVGCFGRSLEVYERDVTDGVYVWLGRPATAREAGLYMRAVMDAPSCEVCDDKGRVLGAMGYRPCARVGCRAGASEIARML